MAKTGARTKEMAVLLYGRVIGKVWQDRNGRLGFSYEPEWLESGERVPLSLSMPFRNEAYGHDLVSSFLWGLLPENDRVLRVWSSEFNVSPANPFALLSHVGEDCAGAVQFVPFDKIDDVNRRGDVQWLSEEEIEARLHALRTVDGYGRKVSEGGQFSLAGAQIKTALVLRDKRWGIPNGTVPTTHIIKPPVARFDGFDVNEHFCLRLAKAIGLTTANSWVERFGQETAIVVARYDRVPSGDGGFLRLHQEDVCQAAGVAPANKYEKEGGPGIVTIMDLMNQSSRPSVDRERFLRACVFNFLIGGTDAHAKNYSILLGKGGQVRLAPLYDIASIFPYVRGDWRKTRMAMSVSGHDRFETIFPRHWESLASQCRYAPDALVSHIVSMAERLPDLARDIAGECRKEGLGHDVLDEIVDGIANWCRKCSLRFGSEDADHSRQKDEHGDGVTPR